MNPHSNIITFKRKYLLIFIGGVCLLLLIGVPFRIPCSISTTGKILPGREYLIVRRPDGGITTQLVNHAVSVTELAGVIQPQRGDAQQLKISERVISSEGIAYGDTLALI
ncbi:hypothetical protein JXO59_04805, partial [candidate division KSB1 bacterium]|nr:hypothetical protein [candidate division KSB1 bacterium]